MAINVYQENLRQFNLNRISFLTRFLCIFSGEVQRFVNENGSDFRNMAVDENFLLLGTTNLVHFLDTRTLKEAKQLVSKYTIYTKRYMMMD